MNTQASILYSNETAVRALIIFHSTFHGTVMACILRFTTWLLAISWYAPHAEHFVLSWSTIYRRFSVLFEYFYIARVSVLWSRYEIMNLRNLLKSKFSADLNIVFFYLSRRVTFQAALLKTLSFFYLKVLQSRKRALKI